MDGLFELRHRYRPRALACIASPNKISFKKKCLKAHRDNGSIRVLLHRERPMMCIVDDGGPSSTCLE
jgi:hypothetical protein